MADKMGEDGDKELRWKDSGDLSSAVRSRESDHRGSESDSEPISTATLSSESDLPGADDGGLPPAVGHLYEDW